MSTYIINIIYTHTKKNKDYAIIIIIFIRILTVFVVVSYKILRLYLMILSCDGIKDEIPILS